MVHQAGNRYLPVRASQLKYYRKIALYCARDEYGFNLYKPAGVHLADLRIAQQRHPALFIRQSDRIAAIKEIQRGFGRDMAAGIESGDSRAVKYALCDLVNETLAEPRSGTLQVLPQTVSMLVSRYSEKPEVLKTLAFISFKDYTTVVHSVNVMALTLGLCFFAGVSLRETKRLGLMALLHDVGKTEVPVDILTAPRRLTDDEFEMMKSHPLVGAQIIETRNQLSESIAQAARDHHEKLDGSGYPHGTRKISTAGQILGIVDCYEALTNEDRPYRQAMTPIDTLKLLKEEVEAGKFNREIFESFCYSLV
jgi:HD-GYP domain-containing protein (c-di-GMP phosphodiesterase class II)